MGKKKLKRQKKLADMVAPLKLDFGCGPNVKEGFEGVDQFAFPGVKHVVDIRKGMPWPDNSVGEFWASHFLEHLTGVERVAFFNELYRVLKPGGTGHIITPHWASNRAYGDWTHQWPPVAEMLWYYLDKNWRNSQAPHTDAQHNPAGYTCDFGVTWGYSLNPALGVRSDEYRADAVANFKESIFDMNAHLKVRK